MANDVLGSVAATRLSLFSLRQALSTYGKEDRNRDAEIPDVAGVLSDLALALAMEGRCVRVPRFFVLKCL